MRARCFFFALAALSGSPAALGASPGHVPVDTPVGVASGTIEPTFDSIQANLFTPFCALGSCHGESMLASLDLRPASSYANLVNVPSVEFPIWDRVEPFDPDHSYLVCKLEGCPEMVGQLMPVFGGPLDPSLIVAVREWVANGASEGGVAVRPASWGQVKAGYR